MTDHSSTERPPIVVVMGHVDHGKTTLLDHIRKANVAAREAGGITQSTAAYEILHNGKRITFIDTPGHEAFSKMRFRGAKAADIAIVVIAADDSVKPQTKEVLQVLRDTKTPFVVAVNKIDKNNADPERVKKDLAAQNVLLEGYGGQVSWQAISAKTGEGVSELLDLVLLTAEVEGLTCDLAKPARGFVVEAKLDRRRGNEVIIVLLDGTLRESDTVFAGNAKGKIKILETFAGERAKSLTPSAPAVILGFETLPRAGDAVQVGAALALDKESARTNMRERKEEGAERLTLILKADFAGTLEAFRELILTIHPTDLEPEIISEGVGDVTDSDVQFAISTGATIAGFRVRAAKGAERLAEANHVRMLTSEIIYELTDQLAKLLRKEKLEDESGELEVLAVFSQKGNKQIVGGKVVKGALRNKLQAEVFRGETTIGRGRIMNLQCNKVETGEVGEGKECGILFDSGIAVQVGDRLLF